MEEGGSWVPNPGIGVLLKEERTQTEGQMIRRQTRVMCLQPGQAEGTHHK